MTTPDRPVSILPACCSVTLTRAYHNLYLDPKETHNYMTRKLAYVEAFQLGIRSHLATFRRYPPKNVMGLNAPDKRQS
jgi:hypothetical protein